MSKLTAVIHSEIRRLSRKEIRAATVPLTSHVSKLKRTVSELSKQVSALRKQVATLERNQTRLSKAQTTTLLTPVPTESLEGTRLSGGLIKKLRKRLNISQMELAALLGVSHPAVASWEQGRVRPREETRAAIVALRQLDAKSVREMLGE